MADGKFFICILLYFQFPTLIPDTCIVSPSHKFYPVAAFTNMV